MNGFRIPKKLTKKQVQSQMTYLKDELDILEKRWDDLWWSSTLIPYTDIVEIFKDLPKIASFLEEYQGRIFNLENYVNVGESAKILDFYIDTRYQRQTDIRKCFKNVIQLGGFDCKRAQCLLGYNSYNSKKYRITDGGHRMMMLILVGQSTYQVQRWTHPEDFTKKQELAEEADDFIISNDITTPVAWIQKFNAWLCLHETDERYIEAMITKKIIDKAKIEVKDGYFLRYAPMIDRLQDLHKMFNSVKTKTNTHLFFSELPFLRAVRTLKKAYPKMKRILQEELNCLSRLYEKQMSGEFEEFNISMSDIKNAYLNFSKNREQGDLTLNANLLQRNKIPTLDYNAMISLFNLTRKQKKVLVERWNPTLES